MSIINNTNDILIAFLKSNGIDADWYESQRIASKTIDRHVRVPREYDFSKVLEKLKPMGGKLVNWVPRFIALPHDLKLRNLECYENGQVYGMDVASGFAALVLDILPGQSILDLCCAPGGKFCMIAELMEHQGTLIGVDASRDRAQTCVTLCQKYKVGATYQESSDTDKAPWECMIVHGDGIRFESPWQTNMNICWDNISYESLSGNGDSKRRRVNKSMRVRIEKERELKAKKMQNFVYEFDRVLVDAECTHDGSLKHMQKYEPQGVFGTDALEAKFIRAENCKNSEAQSLEQLQRQLLENGFRVLKPNGFLVYSTCSFSTAQNEAIVEWLLKKYPNSTRLCDLTSFQSPMDTSEDPPAVPSDVLPGTLRFEPVKSKTSGLFVAKIQKITPDE